MANPMNHRTVHTKVLHLFVWDSTGPLVKEFQAAKHTKSSRAGRAPRESAMIARVFRSQG